MDPSVTTYRFVGVAYFEKNRGAFDDDNPTGFFNSVSDQCITEKHLKNGIMRLEPRCGQGWHSKISYQLMHYSSILPGCGCCQCQNQSREGMYTCFIMNVANDAALFQISRS